MNPFSHFSYNGCCLFIACHWERNDQEAIDCLLAHCRRRICLLASNAFFFLYMRIGCCLHAKSPRGLWGNMLECSPTLNRAANLQNHTASKILNDTESVSSLVHMKKSSLFFILNFWIWWRFCCQFLANATLKLPCLSTNATRYIQS
jgi:hypothetical protein